ncbi:MAG: hypothetical protein Q9174_005053 [Haloplaca sp. 1 TL-2023]
MRQYKYTITIGIEPMSPSQIYSYLKQKLTALRQRKRTSSVFYPAPSTPKSSAPASSAKSPSLTPVAPAATPPTTPPPASPKVKETPKPKTKEAPKPTEETKAANQPAAKGPFTTIEDVALLSLKAQNKTWADIRGVLIGREKDELMTRYKEIQPAEDTESATAPPAAQANTGKAKTGKQKAQGGKKGKQNGQENDQTGKKDETPVEAPAVEEPAPVAAPPLAPAAAPPLAPAAAPKQSPWTAPAMEELSPWTAPAMEQPAPVAAPSPAPAAAPTPSPWTAPAMEQPAPAAAPTPSPWTAPAMNQPAPMAAPTPSPWTAPPMEQPAPGTAPWTAPMTAPKPSPWMAPAPGLATIPEEPKPQRFQTPLGAWPMPTVQPAEPFVRHNEAFVVGGRDFKIKCMLKRGVEGGFHSEKLDVPVGATTLDESPIIYVDDFDPLEIDDLSFLYNMKCAYDERKWGYMASKLFDQTGKRIEPEWIREKLKNCY